MATLFDEFSLKSLQLKNRIVMAPMCQYSVTNRDGILNEWHYVHYTSRAVGGAGLILIEMTDVDPDGRITDFDSGIWSDDHIPAFARIIKACQSYGTKVGIQIAHAGRKAQDAETPVAPSAIAFSDKFKTPRALTTADVKEMVGKFRDGARRAVEAGVDVIELHGAHGYLIHQFQSPVTNRRDDEYGQDLSRFGVEVVQAVKQVMPKDMPLIMRVSAVEYVDNGYGLDHAIHLCKAYHQAGVDIFHMSSGGEGPIGSGGRPGIHPGYQVPFAAAVKNALGVPVIAVGKLENFHLAESVIGNEQADLIAVARGMLRNPYWANEASVVLRGQPLIPKQYERAF
ncbi:MAG: dehydrogenase [Bacilli bacterium]|nr:dehydrogenase [Bacilli bacterium]